MRRAPATGEIPAMPTTLRKVLWFVALWCVGVATVGSVAIAIRFMIG